MKMMKKKRSSRFAKIMSVAAIPSLLVASFLLSGQFAVANKTEQKEEEVNEIMVVGYAQDGDVVATSTTTNTTDNKNADAKNEVEGKIYKFVVEEMPKYPGGTDALMKYLRENVKYPAESMEKKEQGRVIVEFVIKKDGGIANVGIREGVTETLNNEAIRVVEAMPNWKPASIKGEAVNVVYLLPVKFALTTKK